MPQTTLPALDFPEGTPFTLREEGGTSQILDRVRRRFVRLTPEEWVRQHLLRTLIEHLGYPVGLLAVEPVIRTAAGVRRPDVVAFHRDRRAALIVECKAPRISLSQDVLDQVGRYNVVTGAAVLAVTNGTSHCVWRIDRAAQRFEFLPSIPPFSRLLSQ